MSFRKFLKRNWPWIAVAVVFSLGIARMSGYLLAQPYVCYFTGSVPDLDGGETGTATAEISCIDATTECDISITCTEVDYSDVERHLDVDAYETKEATWDVTAPDVSRETEYQCTFEASGPGCYVEDDTASDTGVITPTCSCGFWSKDRCGAGDCAQDEMRYTRDCNPDGCKSESKCKSVPDCPRCTSHDHKECYRGDVYWYDSCGKRGDMYERCGTDERCRDAACVSVGPVCGNGVCEKGETYKTCPEDCKKPAECTTDADCPRKTIPHGYYPGKCVDGNCTYPKTPTCEKGYRWNAEKQVCEKIVFPWWIVILIVSLIGGAVASYFIITW